MRTKTDHTYLLKLANAAINGTRCAGPYVLEWEGSIPGNPQCYATLPILSSHAYRFCASPIQKDTWRGRYSLTIELRNEEDRPYVPSFSPFAGEYHDATCLFIEAEHIARALLRRST